MRRLFPRAGRMLGVMAVVGTLAVAIPVFANLGGSSFDAGDANLVLDDEAKDWVNAPNFAKKIDKLKGQGDDAFGNGTSEDTQVPSLVTDGIPPNKSDITRFYVGSESVNSPSQKNFLYLAWERIVDPTGTTNFDFELNQSETLSSNGVTPVRTPGDILIKYDLANGGTTPVLGFHRWIDGGGSASSLCEANSKFPCWDKVHMIGNVNFEASINTDSVLDPIDPQGGPNPATAGTNPLSRTLSPRTFGEASIDLVGSGILAAGSCAPFASAYLKSRSSDSFNSAIKDVTSPVGVNLSNCGTLNVKKYIDNNENGSFDSGTDNGSLVTGDLAGWTFSITGPNSFSCAGTTDANGDLNTGTCTSTVLSTLAPGQYTITEAGPASKKIGTGGAFDWINTDPGGSAPLQKTATVAAGGSSTTRFGNTCLATANFSVSNVPAGVGAMSVDYQVNNGAVQNVALAGGTGTRTAAVAGLRKDDQITWSFKINGQAGSIAGSAFTLSGYPSCSGAGSGAFQTATVTATKYRDSNADGSRGALEPGIAGFEFELRVSGQNTALKTATSGTNGAISFSDVAPGSYEVHEVNRPTGWRQTEPASNGHRTVTVLLGESTKNAGVFGNTPLSEVVVTFRSLATNPGTTTPATQAGTLSCSDGSSTTTASTLTTGNLTTADSSVTCTVSFDVNPADPTS